MPKSILFPCFLLTLLFGQKEVSIDCFLWVFHVVWMQPEWSRFWFSIVSMCHTSKKDRKSKLYMEAKKTVFLDSRKTLMNIFSDFSCNLSTTNTFLFSCATASSKALRYSCFYCLSDVHCHCYRRTEIEWCKALP